MPALLFAMNRSHWVIGTLVVAIFGTFIWTGINARTANSQGLQITVLDERTGTPFEGCQLIYRSPDLQLGSLPWLNMHGIYIPGRRKSATTNASGVAEINYSADLLNLEGVVLPHRKSITYKAVHHREDGVDWETQDHLVDHRDGAPVHRYTIKVRCAGEDTLTLP